MTLISDVPVDQIKLSDPELWKSSDDERDAVFAKLRAEKPISFQPEAEYEPPIPPGPGYWALTRHADIWAASRNPELFQSGRGSNIGDMPIEIAEFFGSMISMDAPKHTRLRLIVQKAFTPKVVAAIEEDVRRKAKAIVDEHAEKGEGDFVQLFASPLPLQIICEMMGIERDQWNTVFEATNTILGIGDPEYVTDMGQLMAAAMSLYQMAIDLGEQRLANPKDDLTTALMHAEVDGEHLTTQELGSFFILLVAAGNETTRNSISHGMKLLTDHPEQRALWLEDFNGRAPGAVEEIVRYATPVIHFRRTATRDTELSGVKIAEGEKVVLWYTSGNRDETVFPDPYAFDITRPNLKEQMGFGAGGPHYCLGANLARREMTVMFDELLHRLPDLQITGPPAILESAFIHGIKRMPCAWTPA
jgi:methyl-branched lipid omega-hydroxylase